MRVNTAHQYHSQVDSSLKYNLKFYVLPNAEMKVIGKKSPLAFDEQARVHDLKHTYGRRLRAAGVSFEDRQDLLGHRSGKITTHYSAAELAQLIEASNQVCEQNQRQPELVMLRGALRRDPAKLPQGIPQMVKNPAKLGH